MMTRQVADHKGRPFTEASYSHEGKQCRARLIGWLRRDEVGYILSIMRRQDARLPRPDGHEGPVPFYLVTTDDDGA